MGEPQQPGPDSDHPGDRDNRARAEDDGDVGPRSAGDRHDGPDERAGRNVSPDGRAPGHVSARLATAQQGAVKRAQLVADGISRHTVDRRARDGDLHRIHRGVHLVGHEALAPMAREHAALLACGERSLISHRSAAYAWLLIEDPPETVEVTLVGRRCRRKEGIRIHNVLQIDRRDATRSAGIPLSTPARTLIDFAVDASHQELARAVAQARVQGLIAGRRLEEALERSRGRPGAARIRALLDREGEPAVTRSEAERRLRALVGAARLPMPGFNTWVCGYLVDALWAGQRLIIEIDGFRYHAHRAAFESDRRRDATVVAAGYRVIRITWLQLTNEPLAVVATVTRALGAGA